MSFFDLFLKKNKSYALVLSGGGARGFFHIGVIKAIQELKIPITEVSGTSIGAIIGAAYCANPNINFEEIISRLSFFKIINLITSHSIPALNSKLEPYLKSIIQIKDFSEFKIPFKFNATDINNAQEIVFSQGQIFPHLLSSLSIPGIFPPYQYHEKFLVDGGVINNIPISLINKNKNIIVSDISMPIKNVNTQSKTSDILQSSFTIMQRSNSLNNIQKNLRTKKMNFITLNDQNIFLLDFRKKNFQKLIDDGYQQTISFFKSE